MMPEACDEVEYLRSLLHMREEIDRLKRERQADFLELGISLVQDRLQPLPIRLTLFRRPTAEQYQRLLALAAEIERNPVPTNKDSEDG